MSELRQDITTREWVIIATERARRPHEFTSHRTHEKQEPLPEYSEECPFCPGQEAHTPTETFAIRESAQNEPSSWQIRVVPNKFAALEPGGEVNRSIDGTLRGIAGFGYHEVLIETPLHNRPPALMEIGEVEKVLRGYRARYEALRADPRIQLIVIFKNHGRSAGTSLEHPHSQIVGVPIIPGCVRARVQEAQRYYDDNGKCVSCAALGDELRVGKRIVLETESFVAYHPYASKVPFETWIVPRQHTTTFGSLKDESWMAVAPPLKEILARLYYGLDNPDFNLILHIAPVEYEDAPYYHWNIQIFPRLTLQAGFELGSGIYINSALPEQTAQFMREVEV